MSEVMTTLGRKNVHELGMILPHEHVFVDLRTPDHPDHGKADSDDVVRLMLPEIQKAQAAGVTALVECSTVGVGRNPDAIAAVSKASGMPIIFPTGVYREPWVPDWVHDASEDELFTWMLSELTDSVEATDFRAGWMKLSAGDDDVTAVEAKILRAAARVSADTDFAIGSHTIRGRVVHDQLDIIESVGGSAERFIWIHTQAEPDFDLHLSAARRGVWIEYDWIGGSPDDATYIGYIQRMLDAGFGHKLLISHDRGWYDPAQPNGGTPKPYTYISEVFLPAMRAAGLDDATIHQITHTNPFNAFAV